MRRFIRALGALLLLCSVLVTALASPRSPGSGWMGRAERLGFSSIVQNAQNALREQAASPLQSLVRQDCYVSDAAGVLTLSQLTELEEQARDLAGRYDCGVYIVTVDSYRAYNQASISSLAEEIYLENGLGWGQGQDGILLLMSMSDRKYDLAAYGDFGNAAFTDYGKDRLADAFLSDFKKDNWYKGFSDYLTKCGRMLDMARKGKPLDVNHDPDARLRYWPAGLLLGAILALVVCSILKSRMKNVKEAAGAETYVPGNGVRFVIREDRFTHVTTTRTKIERSSGGSSRGGTSVGSSGFSHKSGSF